MKLERRYSAERVAAIALGCSLLVWLALTATALPDPLPGSPDGSHREFIYYLCVFLFAIASAIMMYFAIAAFKRGVNDEIWSDASQKRLLARLNRSVWTASAALLTLAGVSYVLYDIVTYKYGVHPHHTNGGLIYFWMSPVIALGELRKALKPPRPSGAGRSTWLGDIKPLQSDHWGQR